MVFNASGLGAITEGESMENDNVVLLFVCVCVCLIFLFIFISWRLITLHVVLLFVASTSNSSLDFQ